DPMELQGKLIAAVDELVNKYGDVDSASRVISALGKSGAKRAADLPLPVLIKWVERAQEKVAAARASGKVVA
ncbi:hypothetical protein UFOVP1189_40, partial [uncultured Caudovirales phage]